MRRAMLAAAVAMAVAVALGGCAAEQARARERERAMTAAVLGAPSPSLLRYLSPEEREALDRVGMGPQSPADDPAVADDPDGADGTLADDAEETTADKAGRVGVSLLGIGVTVGMLVAPFFML